MTDSGDTFFSPALDRIHERLDPIWPGGRISIGDDLRDHHWTLKNYFRPVSVSTVEACFLFNIIQSLGYKQAIEIGTGFGYSTLWIALAVGTNHKPETSRVVTIDNLSEGGMGAHGIKFAKEASKIVSVDQIIEFREGTSPTALGNFLPDEFDFAFIDGDHRDEQPSLDFEAVERCLSSEGTIVWHDVFQPFSVMRAIKHAERLGFFTMFLSTSCKMAVSNRSRAKLMSAREALMKARTLTLIDGRSAAPQANNWLQATLTPAGAEVLPRR